MLSENQKNYVIHFEICLQALNSQPKNASFLNSNCTIFEKPGIMVDVSLK